MSHSGESGGRQVLVLGTAAQDWIWLINTLRGAPVPEEERARGYDVTLEVAGRALTLRSTRALLNPELPDEEVTAELDALVKSCAPGLQAFLMVLRGGRYAAKERRAVEVLLSNFGEAALRFLVVASAEGGESAGREVDEALAELIDLCDGRLCRCSEAAGRGTPGEAIALLDAVDSVASESGGAGYTPEMYGEARRRRAEDAAVRMLREKLKEAEERERAADTTLKRREEGRARETEEMRRRHAEERERDEAERRQQEGKRESCMEAIRSYTALLRLSAGSTAASVPRGESQTAVVLLGLSGSGKTSAADTILERAASRLPAGSGRPTAQAPTARCQKREVCVDGRWLVVVDTPELWDEDDYERLEDVKDCLALALPGPHAFILVMQVGRFTQGESEILGQIQRTFGREVTEHLIVLFTRPDSGAKLGGVDGYVADAPASLQEVLRRCGGRYYALNNGSFRNALSHSQVKELLGGVRKLVASHGGKPYRCKRFPAQELEERRRQREEEK